MVIGLVKININIFIEWNSELEVKFKYCFLIEYIYIIKDVDIMSDDECYVIEFVVEII